MTTIAVDLRTKQMASDSRVTCGDSFYETDKIFECEDGSLIGFCGGLADALLFVEWMKAGAVRSERPSYAESTFKALVLNHEGLASWGSDCVRMPMRGREFYAMGSGGQAAMGAMYAGAEIGHAIKIATLCDENSGGAVIVKQYAPRDPAKPAEKPKARRARSRN